MSKFYRCDNCGAEIERYGENRSRGEWITLYRLELEPDGVAVAQGGRSFHRDLCSTRCAMAFLMQVEAVDGGE